MTSMIIAPGATPDAAINDTTIARTLAEFAASLRAADIPPEVRERARYLMLDAVGIAHASTHYDFAHRALSAVTDLSEGVGTTPLIGLPQRLTSRDALLMNGILIHGLDYDDTHAAGVVHATSSCLPCALGVGAQVGTTGEEVVTAFIVGIEAAARLGAVAKGGFHQIGFHPTGVVGAFACALIAGRLRGLNVDQLAMAQGIALSVASGSLEFLQDGAWTKRMHPGWSAVAGSTATTLARHGFIGPRAVYEGRFGLFSTYLGQYAAAADLALATAGLGTTWELMNVTVKPIPACHFTHACADAAAILRDRHGLKPSDIASVRALVPGEVVKTVCEPVATKKKPQNSYDAQFSIPYIVATALVHGSFGLQHLEDSALADPEVLALAAKVEYEVDPASPFPRSYSGEVIVTTKDGRTLRQREEVNRGGTGRPISNADVQKKFFENATLVVSSARAREVCDLVLAIEEFDDVGELAEGLAARG